MAALEAEIHASVRGLAEEIREEVKESARHVQEELRAAAEEAQSTSRRPADRAEWTKDDWRDWKRAQHDWKEQWKDQWAAQWREHWQDEAARWRRIAEDGVEDWTGRRPHNRADREQLDELRAAFLQFRDEMRTMARDRRPDVPVTQDQLEQAREVLARAARDLRDIFRG